VLRGRRPPGAARPRVARLKRVNLPRDRQNVLIWMSAAAHYRASACEQMAGLAACGAPSPVAQPGPRPTSAAPGPTTVTSGPQLGGEDHQRFLVPGLAQLTGTGRPLVRVLRQTDRAYKAAITGLAQQASLAA
jgi:hypothetical protein